MRFAIPVMLGGLLAGCQLQEDPPVEPEAGHLEPLLVECQDLPVECAEPGVGLRSTFDSADEFAGLLVGAWLHCEASPEPYQAIRGYEIRSDHALYALVEDSTGLCVRGFDTDLRGHWSVFDISEENPPGTYELALSPRLMDDDAGGTWAAVEPLP
jgi:hypothetical protein